MLKSSRSYEEACRVFRWRIPACYNFAFDACDRQTMGGADGHRTALVIEAEGGDVERYTFHMLRLLSNRLANVLAAEGVGPGDRVAICFGPSVEAAIAVLAIGKIGAVVVPIPLAHGLEPMAWRLADSHAVAALCDSKAVGRVIAARAAVPTLRLVLCAGEAPEGAADLWCVMEGRAGAFSPAVTLPDDPAFLFYPTDPCGKPKGILHAHRALLGNLPPVEFALGFFPSFGDVMWPGVEWMSFEGLIWSILLAWHHGVPVVGAQGCLDPDRVLGVMARHGVRTAFVSPQHLAELVAAAASTPHPMLRALASPSLGLDAPTHASTAAAFGVPVNEVWGTLESGAIAANNGSVMEIRPGSPGRASPGNTVEALDEAGRVVRAGERGMLAVAPGGPGGGLGYLGEPPPGSRVLPNGWLITGCIGVRDLDGYLWVEPVPLGEGFAAVDGVRVDPMEIEAALALHPAVASAAVTVVGGVLKAYVVPREAGSGNHELARQLQDAVAARRSMFEIPRRIEFLSSLPSGEDGRIERNALALRVEAPLPEERI